MIQGNRIQDTERFRITCGRSIISFTTAKGQGHSTLKGSERVIRLEGHYILLTQWRDSSEADEVPISLLTAPVGADHDCMEQQRTEEEDAG